MQVRQTVKNYPIIYVILLNKTKTEANEVGYGIIFMDQAEKAHNK